MMPNYELVWGPSEIPCLMEMGSVLDNTTTSNKPSNVKMTQHAEWKSGNACVMKEQCRIVLADHLVIQF